MQPGAVGSFDEQALEARDASRQALAVRLGEPLRMEDQLVLQQVDDEWQADRDRRQDLQSRGDQVLLYISPPLRTNSTDFSFMPFST